MNEKKILILVSLVSLVILIGGVFLVSGSSSTPQVTASQNAKAVLGATSADWGRIPMNGGLVSKEFIIKNTGTDPLKLFNIKTSCHCTKATVTIDGNESPEFGMSSVSSWVGEVKPGSQAKLKVIFDPLYHGINGLGPISRYVNVETNDKSNSKLTFTVTGTVFN